MLDPIGGRGVAVSDSGAQTVAGSVENDLSLLGLTVPDPAAVSALELAGGSFAFAQHRGQFTAFGLAQFDPITYIHLDLLVGGPDESTNESKIRRCSQRSRLHRKARPVPGLHLHLFSHVPAPARRNRLQCHFQVSPPAVHQMIVMLERNGLIRRQPGVARSIQILVPPEDLPILDWLKINQS